MKRSAPVPNQFNLNGTPGNPNEKEKVAAPSNYQIQMWNSLLSNLMQNVLSNQAKNQNIYHELSNSSIDSTNPNQSTKPQKSPEFEPKPSKSRKRSFSKSDPKEFNSNDSNAYTTSLNNKPRLKSVKFTSKKVFPAELKGYVKLQNELKRCLFSTNKIVNAYINNKNELIIKVDEEHEDSIIKTTWPADAFGHGISLVEKKDPTYYFALNHISLDFDVNDDENKEYMLNQYHIIKMIRMTKKSTNTPLKTIKCITKNKDTFNSIMKKGKINIGNTIVKVTPWDFGIQPNQCFHCQRIGHQRSSCPRKENKPTCVRCSGDHEHTKCQIKEPNHFKCINCGQAHAACSRECEELKKEIERKKKELESKAKNESNFTRIFSENLKYPNTSSKSSNQYVTNSTLLNFLELFILMIKNLNEITIWINETPQKLTNLIGQKLGPIFSKPIHDFLIDNLDIESDQDNNDEDEEEDYQNNNDQYMRPNYSNHE
ncbi:nucleic-acid-binding from mobile element jockey-like [Brachionus plicatilis]|uniref:Nucleic-acid-binding from mobile element jockey-like n=1 Tax=Brachionus plicatilis TaxID=10195 RepID=A0A3M7Q433_BRAPC|nr:nucleic-acid-binding from mobile element jockey-like [Brachionus plicatilis]